MFTFNFAGHDTTAHTFTFALYFMAASPTVQDWISEEIRHVMGDREPHEWSSSDSPRLKRYLAVMYETLRLYTPVPTSKFVDGQTPQPLTVGETTITLPPNTMIVPSYASIQTRSTGVTTLSSGGLRASSSRLPRLMPRPPEPHQMTKSSSL